MITWCSIMSEAVTMPNLMMMTLIVSDERLGGDRQRQTDTETDTHTHTVTHTHTHTHTGQLSSLKFALQTKTTTTSSTHCLGLQPLSGQFEVVITENRWINFLSAIYASEGQALQNFWSIPTGETESYCLKLMKVNPFVIWSKWKLDTEKWVQFGQNEKRTQKNVYNLVKMKNGHRKMCTIWSKWNTDTEKMSTSFNC